MNAKDCKGAGTLCTDEVEQLVLGEIRRKLKQFPTLSGRKTSAPNVELTKLEVELAETDMEINALLEKVKDSDNALLRYINGRIEELDRRRSRINERIRELGSKKDIPADETDNHLTMWEELSFDDKRQVADTLIRVIYATENRMIIQWRI